MSINPLTFLSQFGKMKEEAKVMESKLTSLRVQGESGGGVVKITLNGKLELIDIKLDPIVVDNRDIPMLETLIKSAFVDASNKCKDSIAKEFKSSNLGAFETLFNQS
ncbi:YbaB/EbfC family nucleoid-associated protein [Entomospira entomophila]|uniref:Nucleoid-associated protein HCT14_02480 n=1 Tax=Entomospira entomophila TaxID=2719988 RepID=A0A968KW08_9SPIO|nr:YbaB/EbfC family nucleoid-associated protein [Entomospira entomophilus]NIZ40380.1 YbaB/EbfC family nucleoid-associated protein [Entomospira entomophilus]WDI35939.1 YbaB/EbfC family nucleoid-associated protein [Entomospira entomophilus]